MKILIVLTYYRPNISGLTIYAERLAEAFVKRGHVCSIAYPHYLLVDPRLEKDRDSG